MGFRLTSYYLNTRRISDLSGISIPAEAQDSLVNNSLQRSRAMGFASTVANNILQQDKIPSLMKQLRSLDTSAPYTRVLAAIWDVFTFKGVPKSLRREHEGKSPIPATFVGTVLLDDKPVEIYGQLSNQHLYSDTSEQMLSGKRRILIVGMFEFQNNKIESFPYIIGDMVEDGGGLSVNAMWGYLHSHISLVPPLIPPIMGECQRVLPNATGQRPLNYLFILLIFIVFSDFNEVPAFTNIN